MSSLYGGFPPPIILPFFPVYLNLKWQPPCMFRTLPTPQPNFPLIQQSIQEIANEVAKLENVLPAYLQKNQQDQILILQQLGALTNSVNLLLTGVTACQARYPFFSSFYFFWLTQLPTALVDYQCYFSMPLHLTKPRSCTPQTSLLPPTLRQRKRLQSLLVG